MAFYFRVLKLLDLVPIFVISLLFTVLMVSKKVF